MSVDLLGQLEIKVHGDKQEVGESQVNLDWMEILVSPDQLEIQELLGFADSPELLVTLVIEVLLDRVVQQVRLRC